MCGLLCQHQIKLMLQEKHHGEQQSIDRSQNKLCPNRRRSEEASVEKLQLNSVITHIYAVTMANHADGLVMAGHTNPI